MDHQWVNDLENYGIKGSNKLYNVLSKSQNIVESIRDFQMENSIKKWPLEPALSLLDVHNARRTEFYESAAVDLSDRIITKLKALGSDGSEESLQKLENQLRNSFKLYRAPKVRPIVLETLRQLPEIPYKYLKVIMDDKDFYNSCSLSVRQQIWLKNDHFFIEAVNPIIDDYLEEKQKIFFNVDQLPTNFFTSQTTRARREWKHVQDLVTIVGERKVLHNRLTNMIKERFIATADYNFCSLRMELAMSFRKKSFLDKNDICHEFAWCLDSCVRQIGIDAHLSSKIKTCLESLKESNEVIGELAMIAADVHVTHFLCTQVVKLLKCAVVHEAKLPRDVNSIHLPVRILSLGASAHDILTNSNVTELHVADAAILTKFLPLMCCLIVEDGLRSGTDHSRSHVQYHSGHCKYQADLPESLQNFLKNDVSCGLIWLYYAVQYLPLKPENMDILGVLRYVKSFTRLKKNIAYENPWIHTFVHHLIETNKSSSILSHPAIRGLILNDYLLAGIKFNVGVKYHLLRILHVFGHSIPEAEAFFQFIDPEKILEVFSLKGDKNDMKRYKEEYERVFSKHNQKPVDTALSAIIGVSTKVESLKKNPAKVDNLKKFRKLAI